MKNWQEFNETQMDEAPIPQGDRLTAMAQRQQAKALIKALQAFDAAATKLNTVWDDSTDISGEGPLEDNYPSNWGSYDEEAMDIHTWVRDAVSKLKKY